MEWDHRYLESGEKEYKACSLFAQSVSIPKGATLKSITLPKNPRMHVFALTVQK